MIPIVRRLLAWGVVLSLLLPPAIVLVLALGGVLAGAGDVVGRTLCLRIALGVGVLWAVAVVTTAVAGGLLTLESAPLDVPASENRNGTRPWPDSAEETAGR